MKSSFEKCNLGGKSVILPDHLLNGKDVIQKKYVAVLHNDELGKVVIAKVVIDGSGAQQNKLFISQEVNDDLQVTANDQITISEVMEKTKVAPATQITFELVDGPDIDSADNLQNIYQDLTGYEFIGCLGDTLKVACEEGQDQHVLKVVSVESEGLPQKYFRTTEDTEAEINGDGVFKRSEEGSFACVGGNSEAVNEVKSLLLLPKACPKLVNTLDLKKGKCILLHGPPGCGKTLLAKQVARVSGYFFISVKGAEFQSQFAGICMERIRKTFQEARQNAPSVVFIDELDSIGQDRNEAASTDVVVTMVTSLLTELDGMKARSDVIVIGATNRLSHVDAALRRPGRFDKEIYVGLPDKVARLEILRIHTKHLPLDEEAQKYLRKELVERTSGGYTGSDLQFLCQEAAWMRAIDAATKDGTTEVYEEPKDEIMIRKQDLERAADSVDKRVALRVIDYGMDLQEGNELNPPMKRLRIMEPADVAQCLVQEGISDQYAKLFQDKNVDGALLIDLDHDILKDDFEITSKLERARILSTIKNMMGE
eukprot:m.10235 g.10235  ORF g.10235 m.10235 type:complete len:540 (+) comp4228_c0_seq1:113-1732(+)